MLTNIQKSFLQLVRLGIGTSKDAKISNDMNWVALKAIADRHGLSAIVLDGFEVLNSKSPNSNLNSQLKLSWIGEVMQNYELRYTQYEKAIGSLAGFYNQHSFKMMVLKGYACSLDWPRTEHRPCGDIDIWQFGQQKDADGVLASEKDVKIDDGHEHHTMFYWKDFIVENHYDFIDVHHRKSSSLLEIVFKELGRDDTHTVEMEGEKVYLPSSNLHALFLLRHMMEHFASTEMTLRQLLDWAFFVEKHGKDVDWDWLECVLKDYGMIPAYEIFNAICVYDLGFRSELFPSVQLNPFLKERVLNDILSPEFQGSEPNGLLPRIVFKYRRWKANGWKNELCFKESMWSAFWSGVWGHLLKPKSI